VPHDPRTLDLLRLTLAPGLGPVLIRRLLETFGSPDKALAATPTQLRAVRGIGEGKSHAIARALAEDARKALADELAEVDRVGATLLGLGSPAYPPLLAAIPDPPPILYVRGHLDAASDGRDRFTIGIVGSRQCSHYGTEQAERFAAALAGAGVTVVSGGARGIDSAAHRAALRVGGRTMAVLGCGLSVAYPPENTELFAQIALGPEADPADPRPRGAVISELPMRTPPNAENFPARNRLISGLSLGVLVIEAAKGSGALITARQATDDHGREVYALPGRIDSPTAEGSNELLKSSSAALVTSPADILADLDGLAGRLHAGVAPDAGEDLGIGLFASADHAQPGTPNAAQATSRAAKPTAPSLLTPRQQAIVDALAEPLTLDQLARATGAEAATLLSEITLLEIRRLVVRQGSKLARPR
jgi:DNA processing protein